MTLGRVYWFFPKDQLISYVDYTGRHGLWEGPWLYLIAEEFWLDSVDYHGDWVKNPGPGHVMCEAYVTEDEIEIRRIELK